MRFQLCVIAAGVLAIGGCQTTQRDGLTQEQWARLNLCGAGSSHAISADLQAKVAQDLRSGGVTAALSQDLKTAFLSDPSLPAADRETAYEHYLACVNNIRT